MEVVLPGPVGLGISVPSVAGEVFGHGLVGVEPDLAETQTTGMVLGQGQQPGADPATLGSGQDGHILQQQVAGPGDEDDEAGDLPVLDGMASHACPSRTACA